MNTFSRPGPASGQPRQLVLASSSPYRRALLQRLGWHFVTATPAIDETPIPGEAPEALVRRLAEAKARRLAPDFPDAVIIGSDQMAVLDGVALGKPETEERAERQLRAASGRRVAFLTGLCVLDSRSGLSDTICEPYAVHFRSLTDTEIRHYIRREQPLDCAGSFKSEGLGIALFERFEGDDPNALIGLPLIRLAAMLRGVGIDVLAGADGAGVPA
jgi:septum formation protein